MLTSQLDQNAWQRVATYKSGSKQTWRRIFFCMETTLRKVTDGWNICPSPASTLLNSNSQVFLAFFSSGSDSVLIPSPVPRLCHVFRRAVSLSVVLQHCCLEEDPSRQSVSFPWAVLRVMDFLSLVLVGHSTGKTHETI